jgi:hypothetical protein
MRSDGRGARRIAEARETTRSGLRVGWEVIGQPSWQPLPRR